MDRVWRLIFLAAAYVFVCVVALLPLPVLAFGEATPEPLYRGDLAQVISYTGGTNSPYRNPVTGAANEWSGIITDHVTSAGHLVRYMNCSKHASIDRIDCSWQAMANPPSGTWVGQTDSFTRDGQRCPVNALAVGTDCICSADFQPSADGRACEPYDCSDFAKSLGGQRVEYQGKGSSACLSGCLIKGAVWGYNSATDQSWLDGPFGSGGKCEGTGGTGTDTGTGIDPDPPCPASQCPGTLNGTPVCVPCTSTGAAGPSTGASGAGTGGSGGGSGGSGDGSPTSTETNTECSGGRCTTTTIIRDEAGNAIGQETTEETQASFCEENPDVAFCKDTAFGGSCMGGFTCEGDGVQCAIARQQHARACEFFEPTGEVVEAGVEAANGQARPGDHPGNAAESFSMMGRIDTANPFASICPPDYSFTVMGQAAVIPFASLCESLQLAGQLVVAVAMIAAMVIVFRRT